MKMNKNTIIRICMALVWIGTGVYRLALADMASALLPIAVGLVFAFDAFRSIRRSR